MTEGARRELRAGRFRNLVGSVALRVVESRPPGERRAIRARLWAARRYLVVTGGGELKDAALRSYPRDVRALCASASLRRFDDRAGGGFWPDRNEIWLAAGVETYESRAQATAAARHELFHYVCWNHPIYRRDLDRGFPAMLHALEEAAPAVTAYTRYAAWVRSFLRQGDHANPVEYFADIPTNFPDTAVLPPPLAAYFGALVDGADPPQTDRAPRAALPLAAFHALLVP